MRTSINLVPLCNRIKIKLRWLVCSDIRHYPKTIVNVHFCARVASKCASTAESYYIDWSSLFRHFIALGTVLLLWWIFLQGMVPLSYKQFLWKELKSADAVLILCYFVIVWVRVHLWHLGYFHTECAIWKLKWLWVKSRISIPYSGVGVHGCLFW